MTKTTDSEDQDGDEHEDDYGDEDGDKLMTMRLFHKVEEAKRSPSSRAIGGTTMSQIKVIRYYYTIKDTRADDPSLEAKCTIEPPPFPPRAQ